MQISVPWFNKKNVTINNVEARAARAARTEVRTFLSALENISPQNNNVKWILIFTWEACLAKIQFYCMLPPYCPTWAIWWKNPRETLYLRHVLFWRDNFVSFVPSMMQSQSDCVEIQSHKLTKRDQQKFRVIAKWNCEKCWRGNILIIGVHDLMN